MTKEEFDQLESLLGKLRGVLNARYCIIPGYVHHGPYIALYCDDGKVSKQQIGMSIEDCVNQLTKTTQPKEDAG